MPRITIHDDAGVAHEIDAQAGESLMQVALAHGLSGIIAECGGNCACATCHVYIDAASIHRLPPPADHEHDMLDFTAAERREGSRLSCQIILADALDGLVVHVPDTQV